MQVIVIVFFFFVCLENDRHIRRGIEKEKSRKLENRKKASKINENRKGKKIKKFRKFLSNKKVLFVNLITQYLKVCIRVIS